MEVPLDDFNASFSKEEQAYELASKALYELKYKEKAYPVFIKEEEKDSPLVGTIMSVYEKGKSPEDGIAIFTHVACANNGSYHDSIEIEGHLINQIGEIMKKDKKTKKKSKKICKSSKK